MSRIPWAVSMAVFGFADELLHRHGALTPGKSHTLIRKMIDGSWITLPESDPVTRADDSSQPTA